MTRKILLPLLILVLSSACSIKPPDDNSGLGPEVNSNDIVTAKTNALSGYTLEQAFHTGDDGTVEVVDNVLGNTSVRDAQEMTVTAMVPGQATVTETDSMTGSSITGIITDSDWPILSSLTSKVLNFFALFPDPVSRSLTDSFYMARNFWNSVSFEKSQALGESALLTNKIKLFTSPLSSVLEKDIAKLTLKRTDSSPTPTPGPTGTPPAPASTPDPGTSKYYGLHVLQHTLLTANCSQIPGCKVNSTQVAYVEIRNIQVSGEQSQTTRLNWTYEISNQVPGLFVTLSQCFTTIVNQNSQQIPLQECVQVENFTFGGN